MLPIWIRSQTVRATNSRIQLTEGTFRVAETPRVSSLPGSNNDTERRRGVSLVDASTTMPRPIDSRCKTYNIPMAHGTKVLQRTQVQGAREYEQDASTSPTTKTHRCRSQRRSPHLWTSTWWSPRVFIHQLSRCQELRFALEA